MKYADGKEAKVGDHVVIDSKYNGIIVANIDDNNYSTEYLNEQWSYLNSGVMIDTDFGGLIHYSQEYVASEKIELKQRE